MSNFEFFMTFYGLLLGLAVAELLGSFANLLREPVRPKLGLLTPLTGALFLVQIMTTFFDAFSKLRDVHINFAGLALPTLIGLLFFFGAVMVVPRRAEDWPSLDDYFFRQRRLTIGVMIAALVATLGIELPQVIGFVARSDWPRLTFYLWANVLLLAVQVVQLVARRRALVAAALIFNLVFLIYLYTPLAFNPFGSSGGTSPSG